MAYQTYITDAFVCGTRESNTSDRMFLLFTRDAGMVYAHAKSVRDEKSKHRYALQPFSLLRTTLVRGRGGWKITGTEPISKFFFDAKSREERTFLRSLTLFLRRVMQGESVYSSVFDDVREVCRHMETYNLSNIEVVLKLRVLHMLGYVASTPPLLELLHDPLSPEKVKKIKKEVLDRCSTSVEYALTQSQL